MAAPRSPTNPSHPSLLCSRADGFCTHALGCYLQNHILPTLRELMSELRCKRHWLSPPCHDVGVRKNLAVVPAYPCSDSCKPFCWSATPLSNEPNCDRNLLIHLGKYLLGHLGKWIRLSGHVSLALSMLGNLLHLPKWKLNPGHPSAPFARNLGGFRANGTRNSMISECAHMHPSAPFALIPPGFRPNICPHAGGGA